MYNIGLPIYITIKFKFVQKLIFYLWRTSLLPALTIRVNLEEKLLFHDWLIVVTEKTNTVLVYHSRDHQS